MFLMLAALSYVAIGGYMIFAGPGTFANPGAPGSSTVNNIDRPKGGDFELYYGAARLAAAGNAAQAYDPEAFHAARVAVVGDKALRLNWHYPPTGFMPLLPLSLLDFTTALWLWTGLGLAVFAAALRYASGQWWPVALGLIFPAATNSWLAGQNGLLTAALLGGGLALLPRRAILAGVLFGLLTFKPHLGLLLPVALLAARQWRAMAAAAVTGIVLALATLILFGPATWSAFLADLGDAGGLANSGAEIWVKMPTPFAMLRLLATPLATAQAIQLFITGSLAVGVYVFWRRQSDAAARAAILMLAVPLVVPYAMFYDLALLAFPMSWFAWRRWSGAVEGRTAIVCDILLALVWLAPPLFLAFTGRTYLQPWPLLLLFGWLLAWWIGIKPQGAPTPRTPTPEPSREA